MDSPLACPRHAGWRGRAVEVVAGWHHPEDGGTGLAAVVESCGP